MYSLMVVEDEDMIRRGIVGSIDWESMGFQVVGEARNGKEALEKMETLMPDVMLTDIKMPVMGGIDLSKEARKIYPSLEIVILSGFSDFEYARQAISFRAFDYILKPTNKKKLLEVFKALKLEMDKKKEEKEAAYYRKKFMNEGYELHRQKFLENLLQGKRVHEFEETAKTLEFDFTGDRFCAATVKFDKKKAAMELEDSWLTDQRLLKFSYMNVIEEVLGGENKIYYYVESYDTINFLICFDDDVQSDDKVIRWLTGVAESIQNYLFRKSEVPYRIGIGLSYPTIDFFDKSYKQALTSIRRDFYKDASNIHLYKDADESNFELKFIQFYPEEVKLAAISICNGRITETKQHLTKMFERFIQTKIMPEVAKNYCSALVLRVKATLQVEDCVDRLLASGYMEIVKDVMTIDELKDYVITSMISLARTIEGDLEKGDVDEQQKVIERAKDFMKNHLSEKINLKQISEHVYLSESYFSVLFKKVTGMTYVAYIQELRMNEAKRLLVETDDKIYEICDRIGYSDYKYFSGQFKKLVAMTPKEYRRQGRMEESHA